MAIEHRARVALSIAFIASIVAYPALPPEIPPLWRVGGEWVFIGAPFVAFLLPVTATVIWWLLASLNRHSADTAGRSGGAGAVTALFLSAFHVTMLIAFIGAHLWLRQLLGVIVGVFLIVTGNDLPRVRPNLVWGIRTPQALARDDVWRRVHRLSGYVRVVMGIAVCAASLAGVRGFAELIVVSVLVETVVYVGAATLLSRQKTAAFPGIHTGL
jgi:uncharacterized membrane protein